MSVPYELSAVPMSDPATPGAPRRLRNGRPLYRTAFLLLPVLLLGLAVWFKVHLDTNVGWVAAVVAAVGSLGSLTKPFWKLVGKRRLAALLRDVQVFLDSPVAAVGTWVLFVALITASALYTT